MVRIAYRCRAYPDADQAAVLNRTFGCVRLVWNKTLAARRHRYAADGKNTSYRETDAALTAWKRMDELAFLSEVSCVPLQQTLRHQHAAYQNFFGGRARFPRFKSRNGRQSAHFTRSAFRMREGQLHLAKTVVPLRFVWSFNGVDPAGLNPTMVVVSRETDGRWYVTFAVDTADPVPLPATGRVIGVDLRLKDFAVTSDGERISNPRHLERKARNLARYQRRRVGRVPFDAGVQGAACGMGAGRRRPLVPQQQDLLGVRTSADRTQVVDSVLGMSRMSRPARPGHQRGEEHPCGWSSRSPR